MDLPRRQLSPARYLARGRGGEQPVLLTVNDDNPNGAAVRFLIDGAPVPADAEAYERIVLIFDGEDPDAVAVARERWSEGKAKGFDVTYWQTDEQGAGSAWDELHGPECCAPRYARMGLADVVPIRARVRGATKKAPGAGPGPLAARFRNRYYFQQKA